MFDKSGVYKITNLENRKVYIGVASKLNVRKKKHFSDLKKNKHGNSHLQASYNKYGKEVFTWEIIVTEKDERKRLDMEIRLIKSYRKSLGKTNVYNKTDGGEGTVGFKHSQSFKDDISNRQRGSKGVWFGKKLSQETRNKISDSKAKTKIAQIDPSTDRVIRVYKSFAEAKSVNGYRSASNIHKCANGKQKEAYGYRWEYA